MPTIQQAIANLEAVKRNLKKVAANEMVNYALDNIKGQRDISGVPFKKRKSSAKRNQGRAILVDTGDGRRSIEAKITANGAELQANEYMAAHNEGATIRTSARVRTHTRRRKGRAITVESHTRQINTTLPARTFAGKSKTQTNRIEKVIANQIIKALT